MRYVLRRLLRALLLLMGVSAFCFLLSTMAPGGFFDEMRENPQISPETISVLRARYGLDQPLTMRYAKWVVAAAHGDLGYSIAYNAPVAPLLRQRVKNTLLLTTTAMCLTWLIAVPLGVWSAACRRRWVDRLIGTGASFLISVPEVVMAVGLLAWAVRSRALALGGMTDIDFEQLSWPAKIHDVASHLMLPVLMLALGGTPVILRHVRASVAELLEAPFVQAARGLGIDQRRIMFRHVLPVAANPAISLFGLSVAGLLSGSLLVEVLTGWPGLGPLLLDAALSRDLFLLTGAILFSAVFLATGNFLADVLLFASDPRIGRGGADAT
ncbi:MAG TPA: ABC transporter permease [Terriglobales bacterium]|nr:ABC transporter permease [Terriglobales bacterium]